MALAENRDELGAKVTTSYYQEVADCFNEEATVHHTNSLPDLHEMFTEVHVLNFNMPGPIMAEPVRECLGNSRASMEKTVANYEPSGKGHGAVAMEDETNNGVQLDEDGVQKVYPTNYGKFTEAVLHEVGARRASFLREQPQPILHCWDLCDKQGIIKEI
jgi:hypothetical protein